MNRWSITRRYIPFFAIFLLLFTGCSKLEPGPLNPKGPVGQDQLELIMLSLVIMIVVLVVVFALFFYVLVKYRKRKGQTGIPEQVVGNHKLELIWTIIPLLLLFVIAVPTVAKTFELAEEYTDSKDAVQVKVTANQFWWEFEYKDYNIITAQELRIPVGKKVMYELVSRDVNHSFWIPPLGGKTDNTTGLTNRMYLQADEADTYRGRCAELCGASHAYMNFNVIAVSQEDFDAWVLEMQEPAADTVSEDLAEGYAIFQAQCMTCHAVSTDKAALGPNLKGFANREYVAGFLPNTDENLRDWLRDPDLVKPGNRMPNLGLSEQELDELVKYLNSLE